MVSLINRNAFSVRPTGKFNQWVCSLDDSNKAEGTDQEPTLYLFDDLIEGSEGQLSALEECWRRIAKAEFEAYWEDSSVWPRLISLMDFLEYFECEYFELIHDLSSRKLRQEEM